MDALSEALSTVHMTGGVFFDTEFTAPWEFTVPPIRQAWQLLGPGTERLISFHLLTEGRSLARVEGVADLPLVPGDVVMLPHDDALTVSNGAPSRRIDGAAAAAALDQFLSGELSTLRFGDGGEATRFVCGHFGCERHADRLFLAGLPPMIRINLRGDPAGAWLESSIRHLVGEAACRRPGGMALLSKMAETLFIETLRRYMAQLPPEQTGWLAGARDPVVGRVLALMHRKPWRPWTASDLAAEAGASKSVISERFARFLGEPPLRYLMRWRLQLAARLLQTSRTSILQLALDVGYESEAAFTRAFKREFGLPPTQYRRKLLGQQVRQPGLGRRSVQS